MEFEWDENKRQTNIIKHGIDFIDAQKIFNYETVTLEDNRFNYGEQRFIALGLLKGKIIVVIYTERISLELYLLEKRPKMNNKSTSMKSMTNWERLNSIKDEDIDFSDCPEITSEMLKTATIRSGLKSSVTKQALTLYLDDEIVTWYQKNEESHQAQINTLLKEYIKSH